MGHAKRSRMHTLRPAERGDVYVGQCECANVGMYGYVEQCEPTLSAALQHQQVPPTFAEFFPGTLSDGIHTFPTLSAALQHQQASAMFKNTFDGIHMFPTLSVALHHPQVSATFKKIFPDTFDRAIPVLRHDKVDRLLRELDMAMWQYDTVRICSMCAHVHTVCCVSLGMAIRQCSQV